MDNGLLQINMENTEYPTEKWGENSVAPQKEGVKHQKKGSQFNRH